MFEAVYHFLTTGPGTVTHSVCAIAPLLLAALIGAGTGFLQNKEKQAEADRQRKVEAERERWSPWTKIHGNSVANPNQMGDIANGAASGLSFGVMNQGMFGGAGTPTNTQVNQQPLSQQISAWEPMMYEDQHQKFRLR